MTRRSLFIALAAVFILCDYAQGEIFKCVSPEGSVSYAATPCPFSRGETTVQRPGPPLMTPDMPPNHAHEVHLRAIKNLQVSGKSNVRVVEGENYKKLQASRQTPPTLASKCNGTRYDSECLAPAAGGPSYVDEAVRRAVEGN